MTAQQLSQFNMNAVDLTTTLQLDVTDAFEHLVDTTAADCTTVLNPVLLNQALSDALQTRSSELHAANVANTTLRQTCKT